MSKNNFSICYNIPIMDIDYILSLIETGFGIQEISDIVRVPNYLVRLIVSEFTESGYEKQKGNETVQQYINKRRENNE